MSTTIGKFKVSLVITTVFMVAFMCVPLFGSQDCKASAATYHFKYVTKQAKDSYDKKTKVHTYTYTASKKYGKNDMWFKPYSKIKWKVKNNKIISVSCVKKGVEQSTKSKLVNTFTSDQRNKYYKSKDGKKGYAQSAWGKANGASSDNIQEYYVINAMLKPNGKITYNTNMLIHKNFYPNFPWGTTKFN